MKKLLLYLLTIMIAAPAIISCKKGEEDPFLSMKSRKARLEGEWKLVSGSEVINDDGDVYQVTYDGSLATWTWDTFTDTFIYTQSMIFEKDNTFEMTETNDGDVTVAEGFWAFMKGYDEIANKECVVIRIAEITEDGDAETYSGDQMPVYVFRFLKLTSKEAIIESEGTETWNGNTTSYTSTMTFEKQ
jgi:hypothetical protein